MNQSNPLQFVRRIVGLSQAEFAAKLDLSRSLIAKLESKQGRYEEPSDRVRARVVKEFGAILQSENSPCPALDIENQPYTLASFEKHRKPRPMPAQELYPSGTVGTAMEWLASAAKKTGYSGTLNEAVGKALAWLNAAPGLSEALEKEILEQTDNFSAKQINAANWLLHFFTLPRVQSSVPQLTFDSKSDEPIYELKVPAHSISSDNVIADVQTKPRKSAK
jgi:transcriptional regulator with XRE-family HTH domain